jgi:hypothetical protein
MNKFLLTMQYEEDFLLPVFLHHYAKYFAPQNIFIVDHGSRGNLVPAGCNRIYVPRTRGFSEGARAALIQNISQGLLRYYDFGVYCDCDELISLDRFDPAAFETQPEIYVAGFEVFWRGAGGSKRLLGLINPRECKPLIFSRTPIWQLGFHNSASCAPGTLTVPMAHVRYLFKEQARRRLLERMQVHEHMDSKERESRIAEHWALGGRELDLFYAHVDTYDERRSETDTFEEMAAQSIFGASSLTLPDGRGITVHQARGDWRLMQNRYWDLGDRFTCLFDLG